MTEITSLVSLVITLTLGAVGLYLYLQPFETTQREVAQKTGISSFRAKIEKLSEELVRASTEVEKTLGEMRALSQAREDALTNLESKLGELSKHENELQTRIERLKNVPLPAAQYFLEVTEKIERRNAVRDYFLFGLGVVTTTFVTIVLKVLYKI